jgi:Na+/H+ antiporter NhaD/arsenite permease-like protein
MTWKFHTGYFLFCFVLTLVAAIFWKWNVWGPVVYGGLFFLYLGKYLWDKRADDVRTEREIE